MNQPAYPAPVRTATRLIAVEGPIRVGKSTLARLLAAELGANHVVEPESNPFLSRFYAGEPGMAFPAQMWFLRERYEQLQAATRLGGVTVSDYLFEKDKLFACLNLSDTELALYNRYYADYRDAVARPDLVIYLQAPAEVLEERLRRKGIAGEQEISLDYMQQVIAAYEHYFQQYTASDLLVVDTSSIDFVANPGELAQLLRRATGPVRGTEYYAPLTRTA